MRLEAEAPLQPLRVYSRPGCHLCELLVEGLLPLVRGRLDLDVVDIDTRPEWQQEFGERIPVVEFDGQVVCQFSLDEAAIRVILDNLTAS